MGRAKCVFKKLECGDCECVNCSRILPSYNGDCGRVHHYCGRSKPIFRDRRQGDKRSGGPGTELKRLLGRFFIRTQGGCNCDQRAAVMNEEGSDWCEEHVEVIVGWLRDEAKRRHLPFVDAAGRMLVRRAIRSARRKMKVLSDG